MNKIFITGGSGKIGSSIIDFLLKKNELVVTTSRNINNFYKKIHKHENLFVIEVDFEKNDAIKKITSFLEHNKIEINCLIHNARSLDYLKIESDNTTSKNNFIGEFYMDVVFPYMLSNSLVKNFISLNNIIFISSIYGVVAPNRELYDDLNNSLPINYGVCKSSQIHLSKEMAVRLGPSIRVNTISYGGVKGRVDKKFISKYKKLNIQNKMLEDYDVNEPIYFLISKGSENMTGQNLIIDNGWTVW
jgi:NAD(P)-dependent dehydrogenase (short-subunit alcohol dehydrogenase family)